MDILLIVVIKRFTVLSSHSIVSKLTLLNKGAPILKMWLKKSDVMANY